MAYARSWFAEKAAMKAAGECPCKDCKDRTMGCSGVCKKGYKEWKQRVYDNRKKLLEKDEGERAFRAFKKTSFARSMNGKQG